MRKTKFKKRYKITINGRFAEMKELINPFVKKYGKPVLVHSTPNKKLFFKILDDGKLMVPRHAGPIKHSYIERLFGIYPCVFFSLGFVYASSYDFKYSFIFDLDYVKNFDYYKNSISYQCYKAIVKYWDEHDPEYMKKLASKNKSCKETVHDFYNKKYLGETKRIFDFWKAEKETYELFLKYPRKNEVMKIMKKILDEKYCPYPKSKKVAMEQINEDSAPEIIVKRDVELKKEKHFLGFYIRGKIPVEIKRRLVEEYPDKIVYNGKRIMNVGELKEKR